MYILTFIAPPSHFCYSPHFFGGDNSITLQRSKSKGDQTMALSHKNQAAKALDVVGSELLFVGFHKDHNLQINCPICGGKRSAWVGQPKDGRLASHLVCMAKGCPAKRAAIKVRSERGKLVADL